MTQEQFEVHKQRAERDVFVITTAGARLARALGPQPVQVLSDIGVTAPGFSAPARTSSSTLPKTPAALLE